MVLRNQAVADAGLGEQVARLHRVGLELLAQLLHVHAQVVRVFRVRGSPDLGEELAVGHYFKRLSMIGVSFGDSSWHQRRHAGLAA